MTWEQKTGEIKSLNKGWDTSYISNPVRDWKEDLARSELGVEISLFLFAFSQKTININQISNIL